MMANLKRRTTRMPPMINETPNNAERPGIQSCFVNFPLVWQGRNGTRIWLGFGKQISKTCVAQLAISGWSIGIAYRRENKSTWFGAENEILNITSCTLLSLPPSPTPDLDNDYFGYSFRGFSAETTVLLWFGELENICTYKEPCQTPGLVEQMSLTAFNIFRR